MYSFNNNASMRTGNIKVKLCMILSKYFKKSVQFLNVIMHISNNLKKHLIKFKLYF